MSRAWRGLSPVGVAVLGVVAAVTVYFASPLMGPTSVQAETERGYDADVSNYFQPLNDYQYRYVQTYHVLPEWVEALGLGTPAIALGASNAYLPRLVAFRVASSAQSGADLLAWFEGLVGALSVLLLGRLYGLTWAAAAVSGAAYPLTHVAVRWLPYYWSPVFLAAIPLSVLGLELIWKNRRAAGIATVVLGFAFGGTGAGVLFVQMMVQIAALFLVYRLLTTPAPRMKRLQLSLFSAAALVLGLLAASPGWLPFSLEVAAHSPRTGTPFALIPGVTWGTLSSLVSPTARSAAVEINGDLYVSLLAPFLIAVGIGRSVRSRALGIIPAYTVLLLLVGLKTPVFRLLVAVVPGWAYVSDIERYTMLLAAFPLVLLFGIGTDTMLRRGRRGRRGIAELAATVGISLTVWFVLMDGGGRAIDAVAAIGALALLGIVVVVLRYPKLGASTALALVAALLLAVGVSGSIAERDLGWRPVVDKPDAQYRPWLALVSANNDSTGRWMSYCQSLGYGFTYRPNTFLNAPGRWLDVYLSFPQPDYYTYWQRLTGSTTYVNQGFANWFQDTPGSPPPNTALVNMAGISRILASSACPRPTTPSWQRLASARATPSAFTDTVYENTAAFPEAYLSHRWLEVEGRNATLDRLAASSEVRFSTHVDLVASAIGPSADNAPNPVRLDRLSGSTLRVTFPTPLARRGLLVVLDLVSPGWHAYVDGRRSPVIRTDAVFRGVVVPPGTRSVVLRYEPWWPSTLFPLSWALTALALGCLAWAGARRLRPLRGVARAR